MYKMKDICTLTTFLFFSVVFLYLCVFLLCLIPLVFSVFPPTQPKLLHEFQYSSLYVLSSEPLYIFDFFRF